MPKYNDLIRYVSFRMAERMEETKQHEPRATLDVLASHRVTRPIISLEVNPPRGIDCDEVFARLDGRIASIDLFNVTDCALAKMRCASLPFGALLKARFNREVLVNVSCRDRNSIALQADLLAAWTMGVRSVIALTGDALTVGDHAESKGVFEFNSVGLLSLIKTLNAGSDFVGNPLSGRPSFVPGVVVNPNVKNLNPEIRRLAKKVDAGARYALSQPVFDVATARALAEGAASTGIPILLGLLPFRSAAAARFVASSVPGIRLSAETIEAIDRYDGDDLAAYFVDLCASIAEQTADLFRGFHIVSASSTATALTLIDTLATLLKTSYPPPVDVTQEATA